MLGEDLILPLWDETFIDNFAGGGGASTGIEQALGRHVDAALNHDQDALAMHRMNHPQTRHYPEDIRIADPVKITRGMRVGGAWFSPDCKHFSKAKGGKPRNKKIRGLAWSVIHWINKLGPRAPRVIYLENVEEFLGWCPLLPDGTPSKWRLKWFFLCFTGAMFRRGFLNLEWAPGDGFVYRRTWAGIEQVPDLTFSSKACDMGAPTIRKRLYLIARRDGRPVVWPAAKNAAEAVFEELKVRPHRTAAECINFALPCPSIFLTKAEGRKVRCKRPLVRASLARIAKGVDRYAMKAKRPFIVELTHQGNDGVASVDSPIKTITAANRGEKALLAPIVTYAQHGGAARPADVPAHTITASKKDQNQLLSAFMVPRYGERVGQEPRTYPLDKAGPTVVPTGNGGSLAAIHLTKFNTGSVGSAADRPAPTITANSFIKRPGGAPPLGVVAASVIKMRGDPASHAPGHPLTEPGHTISAGGLHHGVSACYLAQHNTGVVGHSATEPVSTISSKGSQQQVVAMALTKYYGTDGNPRLEEPAPTVTTRDRFGLTEMALAFPPWSPEIEAGARRVAAFLREYGVEFEGEFAMVGDLVIYDLGMRMLKPRELYLMQGFPLDYIIDRGLYVNKETGQLYIKPLTGTAQVKMCGNSVSPPMAQALVEANNPEMCMERRAA